MGVNDFSSDVDGQDEAGISMGNVSEQISEAYKEEVKKGQSSAKKSRKDEKKAKRQDLLLAKFLVKILIDKRYDNLLPGLFKAFDAGVPSNFILGVVSLVYIDISDTIRKSIDKEPIVFHYFSEETLNFSGDNLPQAIKDRVNGWVEDINTIVLFNPSIVYTNRIKESIESSEELYSFAHQVFIYFLSELNIYISEQTAKEYINFIFKKIILPKIKSI